MKYRSTATLSLVAASAAFLVTSGASAAENEAYLADVAVTASIPESRAIVSQGGDRFPQISALRAAAELYRRGDVDGGDAISTRIVDAKTRATAEWVAIRTAPRSVGFERLNRFLAENPAIPTQHWLQKKAEDALMIERVRPEKVLGFFSNRSPLSASGRAALASAQMAKGSDTTAKVLALAAYRDRAIARDVAEFLEKTFPDVISPEERALRAHRLILNNQRAEGLKLAAKLGQDQLRLAQALAIASSRGESLRPLDSVPVGLREHSSYKLALAQVLRRQGKAIEARDVINTVTHDPARLADPDEWWTERRVLARKLLDAGDAAGAYRVVAEHSAQSVGRRAEAEFHAGWIALRYLDFPHTATLHFQESARIAELPAAKSRAAYWRGRAIDAGAVDARFGTDSKAAYEFAMDFPATYYGQLAGEKLGAPALQLPVTEASEADEALFVASPAGQVLHRLLDAGLADLALPMAIDFARTAPSASQADVVASRFVGLGDASAVLAIGRVATARGLALEHHAFPTFGIPRFQPLPGSQDKAMVYAIARQESAFNAKAVSHANARGLMQMLPSTASRTAGRFKVPFSVASLTADPAFCAMLGAAHLGELMEETKGSIVMTFASYNAGGKRVREWIATAGDPRQPGVDVVDWVERIPFYETRHYVQKIMENFQVYKARFSGNRSALLIGEDMERGRR